jgi:MinD superfamily P-loop ATPase
MAKPFEIVILSGKGGTGKTSVAASFASMAENAVFADCDVDAADLHLVLTPEIYHAEAFASGVKAVVNKIKCNACGLCMDFCRFKAIEIINGAYEIDGYACEGCGLCREVCPVGAIDIRKYENNNIYLSDCRFGPMIYGKLGIAEENSGRLVSKIRQYAKETAQKNCAAYIITDGPPGIGCPVIASVTGADLVVAVTEPTLSGWHDLERLLEMISRFHTAVCIIINKYDLNENMSGMIEHNLKEKGIEVSGKISYDEKMVRAQIEGKTINEFEPHGILANELNQIWNNVKSVIYEPKSI